MDYDKEPCSVYVCVCVYLYSTLQKLNLLDKYI